MIETNLNDEAPIAPLGPITEGTASTIKPARASNST